MADVRTPELVINKLTKQQYENIQNPSDTELYLVPEDEEHKPICYPTTASEVNTTSMVVKSSVSDNGKILTENGFVYNTSGNPTVSDTKVVCDLGVGLMEKVLSGLTMNTTYYIKSYGINNGGTSYGDLLIQVTNDSPIPQEYQLVEYIINVDDRQKILLPFTDLSYHKLNVKGNKVSGVNYGYMIGTLKDNVGWECWNGSTSTGVAFNVPNGQFEIIVNTGDRSLIINNTIYTITNLSSSGILSLFKRQDDWSMGASIWKFFELTLYAINNDEICHCYPVYRKADNKPGMYDLVNGVFYTNQGTGEFSVGPDKEWDE